MAHANYQEYRFAIKTLFSSTLSYIFKIGKKKQSENNALCIVGRFQKLWDRFQCILIKLTELHMMQILQTLAYEIDEIFILS